MRRFLKRICFVVPFSLASIVDDLVNLFTLNYGQTLFAMRYIIWWMDKGFGQY